MNLWLIFEPFSRRKIFCFAFLSVCLPNQHNDHFSFLACRLLRQRQKERVSLAQQLITIFFLLSQFLIKIQNTTMCCPWTSKRGKEDRRSKRQQSFDKTRLHCKVTDVKTPDYTATRYRALKINKTPDEAQYSGHSARFIHSSSTKLS